MKYLLIISFLVCTITGFSQKNEKEIKYEKIYYNETKYETNEFSIGFVDAVATDAEIKFKVRIT